MEETNNSFNNCSFPYNLPCSIKTLTLLNSHWMSISKSRGLGRSQGSTRVGRNVWRTIRSPAWEAVFYTIELNWNYYRQGRKGRSPFPAPPRKGRILRLDLTKHFSANTIFDGRCLLQADAYGARKKCIPSFPPFLPLPLKKAWYFGYHKSDIKIIVTGNSGSGPSVYVLWL